MIVFVSATSVTKGKIINTNQTENGLMKIREILVGLVVLIIAAGGVAVHLGLIDSPVAFQRKKTSKQPVRLENVSEAIPVKAYAVKRRNISNFILTTTTLEAEKLVDIVSNSSGQLMKLQVEEGDRVKSNQTLAVIDQRSLQALFEESKIKVSNNALQYKRSVLLHKKKIISRQDVDNIKYQYDTSKIQLRRARLNLEFATIRAPFSGIITRRLVDRGKMVRSGEVLFSVANIVPLRARIYIPENEINRIKLKQSVQIFVESAPNVKFVGKISMISPVVDPNSGTVKVTLDITRNLSKLRPGMFANVRIITETHRNVLSIPKKALLIDTEENEVFVFDAGTARKARLKLGFADGHALEVIEGLKKGDLVITVGHEGLKEGSAVRLADEKPSSKTVAGKIVRKAPKRKTDPEQKNRNQKPPRQIAANQQNRVGGPSGANRFAQLLKNPKVKKEWEKRLKKNPDLIDDNQGKRQFFREMMMKYPTMESLDRILDRILSRNAAVAQKWEELLLKDPNVETNLEKKKKFVGEVIRALRARR